MSAHTIRFFALTWFGSISDLQLWLAERGYIVRPVGTNTLDVAAQSDAVPLRVELTTAGNELTRREVMGFIEAVSGLSDPNAGHVLDALARTQTVIALRVTEQVEPVLITAVLDGCEELGQGLIQADGEGFYEGGVLILDMS